VLTKGHFSVPVARMVIQALRLYAAAHERWWELQGSGGQAELRPDALTTGISVCDRVLEHFGEVLRAHVSTEDEEPLDAFSGVLQGVVSEWWASVDVGAQDEEAMRAAAVPAWQSPRGWSPSEHQYGADVVTTSEGLVQAALQALLAACVRPQRGQGNVLSPRELATVRGTLVGDGDAVSRWTLDMKRRLAVLQRTLACCAAGRISARAEAADAARSLPRAASHGALVPLAASAMTVAGGEDAAGDGELPLGDPRTAAAALERAAASAECMRDCVEVASVLFMCHVAAAPARDTPMPNVIDRLSTATLKAVGGDVFVGSMLHHARRAARQAHPLSHSETEMIHDA
jgi:hypothetical protein